MAARARREAASRVQRERVGSWGQYLDVLQRWPGFRSWAFRGQPDARWPLQTALARHTEIARMSPAAWPRQEDRIRRIFQRKSHLYVANPPADDPLEWLALMAHHGAPTRLLDFTWSPYVAAFFALEHATADAAVWALNLPLLRKLHERYRIGRISVVDADPRKPRVFDQYYLPNRHAFVWQGDPFRMPQRLVAQSGTFLVAGHLGLTVEETLERYPGKDPLLVQFVFDTAAVRPEGMAALYSMNITQASLFPGLDGMARSMGYEFEYSWEVNLETNKPHETERDPRVPARMLRRTVVSGVKVPRPARRRTVRRR